VNPGIILIGEGAVIPIVNIYDRPLHLIYERMRQYWRPGGQGSVVQPRPPGGTRTDT
jgi:hypothetical protein